MTKRYTLFVLLFVLALPAFSQLTKHSQQTQQLFTTQVANGHGSCGTTVTPQQIAMEMARDQEAYETLKQSFINNASEATQDFVIQLHFLRNDNGTNSGSVPTVAQVRSEITNYVNPYFNTSTLNASFVECGPEIYHNSSAYNSLSATSEGDAMAQAYNIPNVINIYIVDYARGACGWANFPSYLPNDYIVLAYGCVTNQSTFVHELGHYFDVYHTHESAFGYENVTRNVGHPCYNAATNGDMLVDTDADPRLNTPGVVLNSTTCTVTAILYRDFCTPGLLYTPDATNIMSYSAKACRTVFTLGQQARMAAAMATSRSYLTKGCIVPCSIASLTGGPQTACSNNTYSKDITVTYTGAPAGGTLDVNGQSFAITSSPQIVTLANLVADGNPVNVTAAFSLDPACAKTEIALFTAPSACVDTIAPVISCPGDIVVGNDAGQCGAVVTYGVGATDNHGLEAEYIINGDFETGDLSGWMISNITSSSTAVTVVNDGSYVPISSGVGATALPPISGSYDAISDQSGSSLHLMSQPFMVPAMVSNAIVSWDDRIRNFHSVFADPGQEFKVEILDSLMNPIYEIYSTNPGDPLMQIGPNARSFDITSVMQSLPGQIVGVRFTNDVTQHFQTITLDNISLKIVGIQQIEGIVSGGLFPVGVTTNKFVVVDGGGNSDTCSFTVTVNDTTSPTFFTDSICLGDSLFVGGNWQTLPGIYTDTATAASGCDSLLITTLYFRSDLVCNLDTTEKMLYIVSDSAWTLSTVVTAATSNSYPWPGVNGLVPHDSTFVLPAEVGQPYPWNHLYTVMGSEVIKAYSGVTYYRYEFELTEHQALNARFRMFVDDNMQIFINRQEVALEENLGKMNWRTANHDILFNDDGTVDNGYLGGDAFDTYTAVSPDSIFVKGNNDIILAIRNRTSKLDKGGFSFRMDLDKAGEAVIVKKEASAGSGINSVPSFDLYPNPVVNQLSLVMESAISDVDYTVTITDVSGRVLSIVSQSGSELQATSTINVSGYASGVYLVKVNSGTHTVVKRFVKR